MLRFRRLNESVHQVANHGDLICDYVGNVRDLLINKPEDYRIIYVPDDDIYVLGDSWSVVHLDMFNDDWEFGEFPKAQELVEMSRALDRESYFSYHCKTYVFVPYDNNGDIDPYDERNLYEYNVWLPIKTGYLLTKTLPLEIYDKKLYDVLKPFIVEDKRITEEFTDYGTGEINGTDIFANTTGISFYDNLLNKPQEMIKHYNLVGEIVYMTPKQYVEECVNKIFTNTSFDNVVRQRQHDKYSNDEIKEVIDNGVRLFMSFINYAEKGQEGLHRMIIMAEMFGWNDVKFPVLAVNWYDEEAHNREVLWKAQNKFELAVENIVSKVLQYQYPFNNTYDYLLDELHWQIEKYFDEEDNVTGDIDVKDDKIIFTVSNGQFTKSVERNMSDIDLEELKDEDIEIDDIDLEEI